jgi:hypothetical protein
MTSCLQFVLIPCALMFFAASASEPLHVPAFTAYGEPNPQALKVSEKRGVTGWSDSGNKVVWHGNIKTAGKLDLSVSLRMPETKAAEFKLTAADKSLTAKASAADDKDKLIDVSFGSIEIEKPGYYSFALEGVSKDGKTFGDIDSLILGGPAADGAHFNLKPRRNAASVHLGYPIPKDAKVEWFYNEVTVREEPLWSYYMACGFHRGYFGIQVNSPTERRIIFSIWDSGNEGVDRKKVADDDRVQLLGKGENVVASDFGNEGTGGHSHLVYNWKIGETYKFLVSAKPDGTHTTYSGYFFFPETQKWSLIATFRAPKDGSYLKGLYSFNENFVGTNGDKRRLAEFGNQWIKTADGKWTELLAAKFTHDPTGKKDRLDYGAGLADGRFYLSNGGYIVDPIKYGDEIKRPATGKQPEIALP